MNLHHKLPSFFKVFSVGYLFPQRSITIICVACRLYPLQVVVVVVPPLHTPVIVVCLIVVCLIIFQCLLLFRDLDIGLPCLPCHVQCRVVP